MVCRLSKITFVGLLLWLTLLSGFVKAQPGKPARAPAVTSMFTPDVFQAPEVPALIKPNGEVVLPFGETRLVVVCAVMQVCDIALQPGETVIADPVLADPRFQISPLVSEQSGREQSHVMVQPLEAGLRSALVIATDRRVYHLELHSHPMKYMPSVSFSYPTELRAQQVAINTVAQQAKSKRTLNTGEYLGDLNFQYDISGNSPFRPIRVFDDGVKTFIQFENSFSEKNLPALLVQQLLVGDVADAINYSIDGNRYVVDQLFDRATLLSAKGANVQSVIITRRTQ